jgi:hypothetical protein
MVEKHPPSGHQSRIGGGMMSDSDEKVIQFSDLELRRRHTRRSLCLHRKLMFDPNEQTVECIECKDFISPFRAFLLLVERHESALSHLKMERQSDVSDSNRPLLRATRRVDESWRSKMVPTCPHCHAGILPEDGFGSGAISKGVDSEQRRFRLTNKD